MPRTEGLTLLSRKILAVLHNRGDWMTRAELADALQYSKLSIYHLKLLKRMIDKGLIEGRRIRTADDVLAYEYRVKP
jgi:predicted transcriptional regulator